MSGPLHIYRPTEETVRKDVLSLWKRLGRYTYVLEDDES